MGQVVDPAFIQDIEHRPKAAGSISEPEGIPSIDLSVLAVAYSDRDDQYRAIKALVADVRRAARDWGFFQVVNHGVPPEKLRRVEEAAKKFFAQQPEEKTKVRMEETNPLGYYETEHTKNVRDWKEVFDVAVHGPITVPASDGADDVAVVEWSNKWPEYPPELRGALEDYGEAVEKLGFSLLELIAMSLGLNKDRLHGFFNDNQTTFIRLNHYPPCPDPHLALGVGRHKDSGGLTILPQDDVGGLQVRRKSDGEWVGVKPTPNAYIVNIGDIIQVWSNGEYESVEHRMVVNSTRERFSIPFFFNPAHDVVVEPLPELLTENKPVKYRGYSWGKFLVTRKRGNFRKLDVENLQFRL